MSNRSDLIFISLLVLCLLIFLLYCTCSAATPKYRPIFQNRFELHSYKYEIDGSFRMQVIDRLKKVKLYYKCQVLPFTKKEIEEDFLQVVIWERPENVKYIKD